MPKSKSCVLKARGRKGYRKITVLLSLFLFSALGSGLVFFLKWHCPCPGVEIPSAFLKPGYFICRHGDGFFSEEIRNFNQKDKRFSHIGVLVPGKTGIQVVHADTQDHSGKAGVSVEKIEVFLSHAQRAGVFRFRQLDEKSVICHALSLAGRPFDWKFDLSDDSALYCTELIDCLYRQIAGKSPLKQRKLGKKNLIPIEACLDKELATEIYVSPPEKK